MRRRSFLLAGGMSLHGSAGFTERSADRKTWATDGTEALAVLIGPPRHSAAARRSHLHLVQF